MFRQFSLTSSLKWIFLGTILATVVGIESKPAFAGCNPFGCSQSSVSECNPFGCPKAPMGEACTPFGCPPSPHNGSSPNNSSSSSSNSQLPQICNSSGENIAVSLGYRTGISRGWFALSNGQCQDVVKHPVQGMPTHYYATNNKKKNWMGDRSRQFCIVMQGFEINSRSGCFDGAESRPFGSIGTGQTLTP
jgi:uncharacterized membrane protein